MNTSAIRFECDKIDAEFAANSAVIVEKDAALSAKDAAIATATQALSDASSALASANITVANLTAGLEAANAEISVLNARIAELEAIISPPPPPPPPPPPEPDPVPAPTYDYFIAPSAGGSGVASDPANISTLDAAIAAGARRIGLGDGVYPNNSIGISHGGTAETPVVIEPVNPGMVTFQGGRNNGVGDFDTGRDVGDGTTIWRRPWVLPSNPVGNHEGWDSVTASSWGGTGSECFRLLAGAQWITFRGLKINRHSRAWSFYGDGVNNITIEDCDNYNNQDHIWMNYTAPAGCQGLTVRNCTFIGFSKSCVRFNGASDGLLVEEVVGDSGWQVSDNFAMGVFVSDVAKNVTCRRVTMRNCLDVESFNNGKYWNGDGFVGERGCTNLRFEDCLSEGHSDGGFDVKSIDTVYINCTARHCKRGFRVWASAVLENCVSNTNHKAVILNKGGPSMTGGTGNATDLWVEGGVDSAHPTNVVLRNCSIGSITKDTGSASSFFGSVTVQ